MRNQKTFGRNVTLPAPADTKSGDGVLIGHLFGVATGDAKSGENLTIARDGGFGLPKTSSVVFAVGDEVYFDNGKCVKKASGKHLIGVAGAAAPSGATEVLVLLNGTGATVAA